METRFFKKSLLTLFVSLIGTCFFLILCFSPSPAKADPPPCVNFYDNMNSFLSHAFENSQSLVNSCRSACSMGGNYSRFITSKNPNNKCVDKTAAQIAAVYFAGGDGTLGNVPDGICGTFDLCGIRFPPPPPDTCTTDNCISKGVDDLFPDLDGMDACINYRLHGQVDTHVDSPGLDFLQQGTALYTSPSKFFNFKAIFNTGGTDAPVITKTGSFSTGQVQTDAEAVNLVDFSTMTVDSTFTLAGDILIPVDEFTGCPVTSFPPLVTYNKASSTDLYGAILTVGPPGEFGVELPFIDTDALGMGVETFVNDYFILPILDIAFAEDPEAELIDSILGLSVIGEVATVAFVAATQIIEFALAAIPNFSCVCDSHIKGFAVGANTDTVVIRDIDCSALIQDCAVTCFGATTSDACTTTGNKVAQCVPAVGLPEDVTLMNCVHDPCNGLAPGADCDGTAGTKTCQGDASGGSSATLCDFGECLCLPPPPPPPV